MPTIIEGKYKQVAVRVMTKEEYKMTIQDNSEVWGIFSMLSLMSVGFPFMLWRISEQVNLKQKSD